MSRYPTTILAITLLASFPWSVGIAHAEAAAGAAGDAPVVSPFGPGWDPTRPAPEAPTTAGAGIVSATLVAAGAADVEELRDTVAAGGSAFFGVALDIQLAADSVTPVLGAASVFAEPRHGESFPLLAACTPTMEDPLAMWHGEGAHLNAWHIAIDGHTWFCGGRTARLAIQVGKGGFRLKTGKDSAWSGPLVLLFESHMAGLRRIVLPKLSVYPPIPKRTGPVPAPATRGAFIVPSKQPAFAAPTNPAALPNATSRPDASPAPSPAPTPPAAKPVAPN